MKVDSEIHLLPSAWNGHEVFSLQAVYARAFSEAKELFVVSAFLTEWPSKLLLNSQCQSFLLIIGADFGTTRRAALEAALQWLPKRFSGNVLAFNQRGVSFHPKAVLWREHDDSCHFLIGSSNLTKAAFESNVEANVTLRLSAVEYDRALEWLHEIEGRSVEVNDRWLERYKEAPIRGGGPRVDQAKETETTDEEPIFDFALELESSDERRRFKQFLDARRAQRAAFDANAKQPLLTLLRSTVANPRWTAVDNGDFYEALFGLWAKGDETRLGGLQWTIRGKHANHQELAKSLLAVIDASTLARDAVVARERDRLRDSAIATRSAVMTELLCHFFPTRYPILDAPVRKWRSAVGFDKGVGGTEGERYIRLAHAMRAAQKDVGPQRLGIADLAELDTLIWFQQKKHEL